MGNVFADGNVGVNKYMNIKTRLLALAKIIGVYAGYFVVAAGFFALLGLVVAAPSDSKYFGIIFGAITLLITIGYHLLILKIFGRKEKPKLGFEIDKNWFLNFILGTGFAAVCILVIWLLALVFKGFTVRPNELTAEVKLLVFLWFVRMLFTGFQEELITRGTLAYIGKSGGKWFYAVIISILFSVTHGAETISVIFYLNLFLFSIIAFQLTWICGNLWPAIAFHFAWNFVMGGILGVAVSGVETPGLLVSEAASTTSLISGGTFGLEGSIFCTIIAAIAIAGLFYLERRKGRALDRSAAGASGHALRVFRRVV